MEQNHSGAVHGRTNPCPAGHDKCRVGHGFDWPEGGIGNGSVCDPDWPPLSTFPRSTVPVVGFDFSNVLPNFKRWWCFLGDGCLRCSCRSGAIAVGWIAPSRAKSWSPVPRMDGETRHGAGDGVVVHLRSGAWGGFRKRPPNRRTPSGRWDCLVG